MVDVEWHVKKEHFGTMTKYNQGQNAVNDGCRTTRIQCSQRNYGFVRVFVEIILTLRYFLPIYVHGCNLCAY